MVLKNNSATDNVIATLESIQHDLDKIIQANHHDPFSVLGNQTIHGDSFTLFYSPNTVKLTVSEKNIPTFRFADSDFFVCTEQLDKIGQHYLLNRTDNHKNVSSYYDPYSFKPQLNDFDLHLFSEGKHLHIYRVLGAHSKTIDGIDGVLFATWAPNAARVSVVGDFNEWDGRRNAMRSRGNCGVWELFIPGLNHGTLYKYEIRNRDSGAIQSKSDQIGRAHV